MAGLCPSAVFYRCRIIWRKVGLNKLIYFNSWTDWYEKDWAYARLLFSIDAASYGELVGLIKLIFISIHGLTGMKRTGLCQSAVFYRCRIIWRTVGLNKVIYFNSRTDWYEKDWTHARQLFSIDAASYGELVGSVSCSLLMPHHMENGRFN